MYLTVMYNLQIKHWAAENLPANGNVLMEETKIKIQRAFQFKRSTKSVFFFQLHEIIVSNYTKQS